MASHPQPMKYRYNPSLGKPLAKVYRPWYFLFALFTVLIGIGVIACAVAMKAFDGEIKDELFHLWVGIPLVFTGIIACIVAVMKNRKIVSLFLIIVIIVAVVCAASAFISGLIYWNDGWKAAKHEIAKDAMSSTCRDINDACKCDRISVMPSTVNCDNLKLTINLLIAEICLSCAGFAVCVAGTFLGFMSICCGPWQYMEDYDKHYDPDFSNNYPVQHRTFPQDINVEKAHANPGFANGNPSERFNHQ